MAADKQDKVLNFSSEREQSGACSSSAEREKNQGKNFLNVPTLRFPEFSGEWHRTTIGECCSPLEYGMNAPAKEYDGMNKYIRITDIDEGTYTYKYDDVVSPNAQLENKYKVQKNDILFARTGASTGKAYLYNEKDGLMYYGGFLIRGNVKPAYNAKFVFLQTQTQKYKKWVDIMSIRSGQPGINSQEYSIFKFHLPPSKAEQDKISTLFSLLDERIATQIRIIKDLKSLSDVICERLYNPSEKNSWQTYKYADLFSISNERNSKLQYTNVLSASQEYGMIERNELNIDIKFEASSIKNYKIVRPNQYVIHLRSFQGGFAYSDKTGVCSPAYTILVPNEKLSTAFLKYYFTSKKFIDSLRIVTYGIRDGRSISVEEFLQLKVTIPDVASQQHIVHVMQLWEEKIKTEESYLSKLQQQKQYLLSTMFV